MAEGVPDRELIKELMLWQDFVEDQVAAMPLWKVPKTLATLLTEAGYRAPETCGCRLYRDDPSRRTRCVCSHDLDWHEEKRRCWSDSS